MTLKQFSKYLLWTTLIALVVAGIPWTVVNLQLGIKAAYYEWGVTCIIVSYAEDHYGSPPNSWHDLVGYEYHSQYLPNPKTIDAAAQHVSVNFESLIALHKNDISELPVDVIRPIRGIEQHWISPKYTLERYFRDGERPHGSLDGESAKQVRQYAESDEQT